ncbi:MAG: tRNA preQ1(34) S-adenosylmethionine ribosyltransferase-isomerase QueA [Candidatus Helarchaeota archaeon]
MINLEDYDYNLPPDKIAQYPAEKRDHSRLLILTKDQIKHLRFFQIIHEINAGDIIIINNSKVIGTKLIGRKETGGKIECIFLKEIDPTTNRWDCLLKGRKLRIGTRITFFDNILYGIIKEWKKFGQFEVEFFSKRALHEILKAKALITLPPYIKAPQKDLTRYQTIYSCKEGSVAAPTAGFHFTPALMKKIEQKGAKFVQLTLHVGYSTFMPLNEEILQTHKMDSEYFSISPTAANLINQAVSDQNRLIAVGTTTLKALESATDATGKITKLYGWSNLFISPGYRFNSKVTRLITNFHMPKSSPLLMVCAFSGRNRILKAYQEALSNGYRFYSFGDAMLIDRP